MTNPAQTVELAEPQFDWRNPHYAPIWAKRMRMLAKLRDPKDGPRYLQAMLQHYRAGNIDKMIEDWGVTYNPKNAGTKRPILMTFTLFPRQREFIQWLWERYKAQRDGIMVKSRDCGASWLAMAFSVCLCRLEHGVSIGFGSAIEDKVDRSGDPDCLFWKGRRFIAFLPRELRGDWDIKRNNAHMRTWFSDTESSITGEAGDRQGRGGRKTMYFPDEFAFVERPKIIDSNLLANTDCRIEMSTVNGLGNVFAERARGGKIPRFDFHYRDDPRKVNQDAPTEVTYDWGDGRGPQPCIIPTGGLWPDFQVKKDGADPTNWAQEYDCDFAASVEGVVIPQEWVQAAIGAAERLGISIEGVRRVIWDLADAGKDKNSNIFRHGISVEDCEEFPGGEARMRESAMRTYEFVDKHKASELFYDGDGMGGPAGSILKPIVVDRKEQNRRYGMSITSFRGSGKILDPEKKCPGTENKNKDYLENQKAQSWMALRWRFWNTSLAVNGQKYDATCLISLNPKMKMLTKLTGELSQPTRQWSKTGKLMVDKTPDDVASPNCADGVMMGFGYVRPVLSFTPEMLESLQNG
jgi:phage terminase large subunit